MDAQTILSALKAAGLPVTGLSILDPANPDTWKFEGLTADQRAKAIAVVQAALAPELATASAITRLKFLELFTPEEYAALRAAAMTGDVQLLYADALLAAAAVIHPDHPIVQQMLDYAVSGGLLKPDRRQAIEAGMRA